ncbi:MAG: 30S ribosomal protein S6 [Omnitrophica WOR_2 bacterium RBG_13_44_8b]|nr:MAG: 30S ribosomal protein S6 [Omnitrophica WOR_2 bacterium RBG_13_44_8b]
MNKYEGMFIVRADLSEEDRKGVFNQLGEAVQKNNGTVGAGSVWLEKRKLYFPIKKQKEGLYYLMEFSADAQAIKDIRHAYQLNENVLRVLISNIE